MERIKKNKVSIIISAVLILTPLLIGLLLWNKLPESIPNHFNISGEADRYGSKAFTVFGLPLLMLVFQTFMVWGTSADPKGQRISDKVYSMVLYIIPVVTIFVSTVIYLKAIGYDIDIIRITMWLVSSIFVITGNYLPKTRQNYTIGFRFPWTLDDQENWDKTNRLGGYLMMTAGILIFISTFFSSKAMFIVLVISSIIASLTPIIYSYVIYRNKAA